MRLLKLGGSEGRHGYRNVLQPLRTIFLLCGDDDVLNTITLARSSRLGFNLAGFDLSGFGIRRVGKLRPGRLRPA